MMDRPHLDLAQREDIVALAKTCPRVTTVVHLLVKRVYDEDPSLSDGKPGFSEKGFRDNHLGTELDVLLVAGFVKCLAGRVLLADALNIDVLEHAHPGVKAALMVTKDLHGDTGRWMSMYYYNENHWEDQVEALVDAGLVVIEKDPTYGPIVRAL